MKKLFLLFMTLLLAFGIYELKAMPTEQKFYVPDIFISYDVDTSYGIDGGVIGFTFSDIIGGNIRILHGAVLQATLSGDYKTIIQEKMRPVPISIITLLSANKIDRTGIDTDSNDIKDQTDYTLLGYSIKY